MEFFLKTNTRVGWNVFLRELSSVNTFIRVSIVSFSSPTRKRNQQVTAQLYGLLERKKMSKTFPKKKKKTLQKSTFWNLVFEFDRFSYNAPSLIINALKIRRVSNENLLSMSITLAAESRNIVFIFSSSKYYFCFFEKKKTM